jgi:hypothetical protein
MEIHAVMRSSYCNLLYHIVFSTKGREELKVILKAHGLPFDERYL